MFKPVFKITKHLMALLENISVLKGRIEALLKKEAYIVHLKNEALVRNTHASTAIEGNPLNEKEVSLIVAGKKYDNPGREVYEIKNYLKAIKYLSTKVGPRQLTIENVLTVHKLIGANSALDRGPMGQFRGYQVYVGNHQPPNAKNVPLLMKELIDWINKEVLELPAVFSSAILHYQFEFIHPFGDGNGRVGRLLAMWELYRREIDSMHIFSIDELLFENRPLYYRALSNAQAAANDLTSWVEFMAEITELSLERTLKRVSLFADDIDDDDSLSHTPSQEKLLQKLAKNPLTIREIMRFLNVTKPGAHYILKPLLKSNKIERVGGYKTGKYRLLEYIVNKL